MISIKLEQLLTLSDEDFATYEAAGVLFLRSSLAGYEEVIVDPSFEGAQNLSKLSSKNLNRLYELLYYTEFEPTIERAAVLKKLHNMTVVEEDGYPAAFSSRPVTGQLYKDIPDEISRLSDVLKEFGIDQVRVGIELEFFMPNEPLDGFNVWQDRKKEILQELQKEIQIADENQKEKLAVKITAIKDFNAREVLMYDLISCDERVKKFLEPLFGVSRDGDGYYDAEGILELKIAHININEILSAKKAVIQILYEKAATYGLAIQKSPIPHVSFSCWQDDKNILEMEHPEYFTMGGAIAEGMTRAAYDAFPLFAAGYSLEAPKERLFTLTVDRENDIRFVEGRIEVRFSEGNHLQDSDLILPIMMAGMAYGISKENNNIENNILPASLVLNGTFHHTPGACKIISHVLGNAIILGNGELQLPENYIYTKAASIGLELGINVSKEDIARQAYGMPPVYAGCIVDFFKKIRVVTIDGDIQIQWPQTEEGYYKFLTPEVNIDKLPAALQAWVRDGNDLEQADICDYIMPGDNMPKRAEEKSIHIQDLESNVWFAGSTYKYIVEAGYDLNDTSTLNYIERQNDAVLKLARLKRFAKSTILNKYISACLGKKLFHLLHAQMPAVPSANRGAISLDHTI